MDLTIARKPKLHVHVPYGQFWQYEPFIREHRFNIELYVSSFFMDRATPSDILKIKDSLDWNPSISIHGPFMDLSPGAIDSKIATATRERILETITLTAPLNPNVIVLHSGYESWKYAGDTKHWLENSQNTWRTVMDEAEKTGVRIAIENIIDERPDHLRKLADEMAHPLFGLCLDVGHRELFSKLTVEEWVAGMEPHIFELHLHDNNGEGDDHIPVGEGQIKLDGLLSNLDKLGRLEVCTLEAHSKDEALRSVEHMRKFGLTAVAGG